MKSLLSILLLLTITIRLSVAQSLGVGTTTPNNSAMLDIQSNTKGMLIPRMTTAQRAAISSPATGLLVFDNTTGSFWFKSAGNWVELVDTLNNVWKKNGADAYVGVTGNVGIGTNVPGYNLHINRPNARIGLTDTRDGSFSGYLEGNFLDFNINASRAVFGGTPGHLTLQTNSAPFVIAGNVGIGTLTPTSAKLQIEGGTNAAASGGGYLQLGTSNTINIGFDNNEIQARNNGAASKLYMQTSGGDLQIGGASNLIVKEGYQVYRNRPLSTNADLLPIAYASMDGPTATVLSGTGNLSLQRVADGEYRLVLLGEPNIYQNRNSYSILVSSNNIDGPPVMIGAEIKSDNSISVYSAKPWVTYTNNNCGGNTFSYIQSSSFYQYFDCAFTILVYKM